MILRTNKFGTRVKTRVSINYFFQAESVSELANKVLNELQSPLFKTLKQ